MRSTLALDDPDNRVELTEALEAAFAMRFSVADAAACRTVGDVFQILRSHFPPSREGTGGCATAMVFYRVRQALADLGGESALTPTSDIEHLAGRRGRSFLERLGQRSGLRSPRWEATLVGRTGGWMMLAGLVWLLTAADARHLWYTAVASGALGLALVLLDPGKLPADCRTLGGLARKMAALNFGNFHAQGAQARERDLWAGLVEILSEHALVLKAEVHPGTLLLSKEPRPA